jgi:prolyl oligopeptidase
MNPAMRPAVLACALAFALAGQAQAAERAAANLPPPTVKHPVHETLAGQSVDDPWRWLEDGSNQEVKSWIEAQNAYTEKSIAAIGAGKSLTERVKQLSITSTTRSGPMLAGGTLFFMQHTPPQSQPVLMAQAWPKGEPRVLVDLNANGGGTAMTGYWPSPSGRYLAYGTAEGGSELTTLHVLDTTNGKTLPDSLPWAGGGTTPQGVAWDKDEKGLTYVRFAPPPPGQQVRQFDAVLAHHAMGSDPANDPVVFGQGYSKVAEYILMQSPEGKTAVLANEGDGGAAEVFLKQGNAFNRVLGHQANVRGAHWVGEKLYVESFEGAPRGKLLSIDGEGAVQPVLAQGKGALQGVTPFADGFLAIRSWGPDWWAEQYDAQAKLVRRLPLPETGITVGAVAAEAGQARALISYTGWTAPPRWVEYDGQAGTLANVFEVKPAADYSNVQVQRVQGLSKDGTAIPVTVISMKGIDANGRRPTILYSYGGFDIPITPGFIGSNLAWLERGGILAYANIRGGNEFGQDWHAEGQKLNKQNVFDDFHAAAQALVSTGWTDAAHLGIRGGSNGGLLMGAALTQHPEAYRAVVAQVGIYDVPRHETAFANGPYNISEYGTVADPAQAKATLAYSPLQRVKKGTKYPAVLMTTGANDPRVAPWQSRKFTAALQDATTSGQPILLLTRMNAGHGIGAPFSQRVGDAALALTFFAGELGLPEAAPAPSSP